MNLFSESLFQLAGVGRGVTNFVVEGVTGTIQFGVGTVNLYLDLSLFGALGDVLRETFPGDDIPAWVPSRNDGLGTIDNGLAIAEQIRENPSLIWDSLVDPTIRLWAEGRYGEAATGVVLDIGSLFVGVGVLAKVAHLTEILSVLRRADSITLDEFDSQLDDVLRQLDELGKDPDLVRQAAEQAGLPDEDIASLDYS